MPFRSGAFGRSLDAQASAATVNTSAMGDAAVWHTMSPDEVVKRLTTNSESGLDLPEASARLQKYGLNRLPEGKKRGQLARFFSQFNNVPVYVLLTAGFVKLMLSRRIDATIIFAVVVLNALLGFIHEGKAEKALDSTASMPRAYPSPRTSRRDRSPSAESAHRR
jgi:magnesium-transporting ATPase (P-type)